MEWIHFGRFIIGKRTVKSMKSLANSSFKKGRARRILKEERRQIPSMIARLWKRTAKLIFNFWVVANFYLITSQHISKFYVLKNGHMHSNTLAVEKLR